MKKHLLKSLLALALVLITGNAWATDYNQTEISFKSSSLANGWTTNGVFNSSYYKIQSDNYAKGTSAALFSSEVLSSDMVVNVACGTFGNWSSTKSVTITASFFDFNNQVLTTANTTYSGLNSTQGTYRGEFTLKKPDDPAQIAYLKIVFSNFTTGTDARFAGLKLTYKTEAEGAAKLESLVIDGSSDKMVYDSGEEFDPTGLVVTGYYDDDTNKEISEGIEWTITPSPLTVGTTSVDVIATVGEVSSDVYTVTGLTVNEHIITPGAYTINLNNSLYGISTGNNGTEQSVTTNDITIVSGCSSSASSKTYYDTDHIRYYTDSYLKLSVPEGYEITQIIFTSGSTWNANGIKTEVGTYTSSTNTWTGSSSAVDFSFTAQCRATSIKVTYAAATVKTLESISVTNPKTEFYKGDTFEFGGTVTASYEEDDIEDEDVTSQATFEGYDMSAAGTQTVIVTYKEKQTTYQIAVNTIANTLATAYTTGAAKELIDAGKDLATEVYVKGRISEIVKYESGKITYWLDDKTFEVYHGKNLENTSFTSANDIEVGADVVVYGKIKKYSSIYEFDEGNYLVSYSEPTKTGATIELGTYKTTLKVGDADDEYTVTYDGDGELSITSSDEDVAEAIIIDGTVLIEAKTAGTTTITISAPETDNYYSATKSYTLKVVGPASLPFAYDGGKENLSTGMTQSGLGTDYASAPKLKFDTTGDNLVIWFGEKAGCVSYDIKGNSFSGGTFEVMESADGNDYSVVATYTELGGVETMTNALKSDTRYVKFIYTNKDDGNVALGSIKICRARDVTIASSGKSTLYLDYAATVPEGVKAYYATGYDSTNDIVTMTEVTDNTIAKNQGVMLMGEAGETYTFEETVDVDAPTTNYFGGSVTGMNMNDKTGEDGYYILQGGQFAPISDGDLPAYKAYLYLEDRPYTGQSSTIGFRFGDATQIENVNAVEADKYFDLMGREVLNPAGGIYILNGKKVLVK